MQENPFPNEPLCNIEWRHVDTLHHNLWNPNRVFDQELALLEFSLLATGWIQPLLINREGVIIDGFHRWMLCKESQRLQTRYGGLVPCAVLAVSEPDAMMMTIRINRAKGTHAAVRMSDIVKTLIDTHGCEPQEIAQQIGANLDEVDLLYQDSLFVAKNMKNYQYSRAWIPKENGKKTRES